MSGFNILTLSSYENEKQIICLKWNLIRISDLDLRVCSATDHKFLFLYNLF